MGTSAILWLLGILASSAIGLALLLSTCVGRMLLQLLSLPFVSLVRLLRGKEPCPKGSIDPPCWAGAQPSLTPESSSYCDDESVVSGA